MKKFYKILTTICFAAISVPIFGQQNIAPQATVSASTCNTGACSTLNDLVLGTCGTQIMWITTNTPPSLVAGDNWIQWDWTSAKSINKFVIHHAQTNTRFLAGATIQSWNGSAWVTVSTFANLTPNCSNTVNFPLTTTTRLRITSFTMSGTQLSNPNFREIEVYGPNVNNDASVTGITNLSTCTYTQKVEATVTNWGKKRLDSFRLSWSVNNVNQGTQYITSNLTTGQSATYTLSTGYTFTQNTFTTVRAWTSVPNGTVDSLPGNDLFALDIDFMGSPADPGVTDFTQCGRGFPKLTATTGNPNDSVYWYDQSSGGNFLGMGKTITGPYTIATRTFYAQTAKLSKNFSVQTVGTTGVNVRQTEPYGGMQTIIINKAIMLDSIMFRLWYATPTNCGYQLYYKTGSHTAFLTTPSAWTKINEGVATFVTRSGANYGRVSAKRLVLPPGTYSFYLTTDLDFGAGNSLYSVSAGPGASNADIAIQTGGNIIIGKFGSTQTLTYQPELTYIYKNQCLSTNRTALNITVKPRPIGADVLKSTPFQGHFRLGVQTNPDVVEVGKTLAYELTPPSGFNNTDHNTTWMLTAVKAVTSGNVTVPPSDYVVSTPLGSNRAKLTFKPKSVWLDSLITFSVSFMDLGPHFCDSTVTRSIYVAPTPKTNFTYPSTICLGDQTLFENLTTIHSGVSSYMWYFGDNDSSDLNSPVHEYKLPGTYQVKLVAKSFRWDVIKDTTITVNVSEVPLVDFKVTNACEGNSINLVNNTFIGNGVLTYEWDYGDKSPKSTSKNTSKKYAVPGPYMVTLSSTANGCSASKSKVVYQFATPKAMYSKLNGDCLNDEFNFINQSTISLGQFGNKWDFDDGGNIASDLNTEYTFSTAGFKNVKLIVISEFGCKDSISKTVFVKQIPVTDFIYPYACNLKPTPFTNTTNLRGESLLSYSWNFGNNQTSSATNPTVNWPGTGLKTVTLKTSLLNGCSTQIEKKINVGVQPQVDFEFEEKCSGDEIEFTNLTSFTNGKINYEWNFGDQGKSNIASPTYTYNTVVTQTYYVQLKATILNGCSDSLIKTLTVNAKPATCDFDIIRTWTLGKRGVVLRPTGGNMFGTTYTWILGDGNRRTTKGTELNYSYNGDLKYCITMTASNDFGCECFTSKCIEFKTDLESIDNSLFSIYPNPSSGIFNLTSENANQSAIVYVYNSLGEMVFTTTLEDSCKIDLSDQSSGIYTVRIVAENMVYTRMITITK